MATRREFIKGAAASGLVFCSWSLIDAVSAQGSHKHPNLGTKRKPVIVNGNAVKTIDVHSHCLFRDAIALMGAEAKGVEPAVKGAPEHYIPLSDKAAVEERLAAMDAMGVDREVLSINPFWYRKDRDTAAAIVKLNNERLEELGAAYATPLGRVRARSLQAPVGA